MTDPQNNTRCPVNQTMWIQRRYAKHDSHLPPSSGSESPRLRPNLPLSRYRYNLGAYSTPRALHTLQIGLRSSHRTTRRTSQAFIRFLSSISPNTSLPPARWDSQGPIRPRACKKSFHMSLAVFDALSSEDLIRAPSPWELVRKRMSAQY